MSSHRHRLVALVPIALVAACAVGENGGAPTPPAAPQLPSFDAELDAEHGLPLTSYEVLLHLAAAPERKMRMFDLSDAFVALPGGFGTLDEMFEMLTWRQLGIGNKPCAFLDVDGFFAPLIQMIDRMVEERFLHPDQRQDLWHGEDADAMLGWMRGYEPASASKWLDEKRRKSLR